MDDDETYSLITVRRGNRGVVSRGEFKGRKVLVKSQFKVLTNDFVISKRQIVHQACGIVPEELNGSIVSNEYDVFQPSEECCIRYFDYMSYRPEMRHAFYLSCVGVHLEKMLFKTNDWPKRRFYFPTLPEQRKIADFLTAVDRRLAQLSQKKPCWRPFPSLSAVSAFRAGSPPRLTRGHGRSAASKRSAFPNLVWERGRKQSLTP